MVGRRVLAPITMLIAILALLGAPDVVRSAAPPPDRRASPPLVFEANRGQADPQVNFVARGAGYTAFLTSTETVLQLGTARTRHATVHLKPVGADAAARILGDGELPGVVNYFRQGSSAAMRALSEASGVPVAAGRTPPASPRSQPPGTPDPTGRNRCP